MPSLIKFIVPLALSITSSNVFAADLGVHDTSKRLDNGIEITASPVISKSAVRRMEREKEKRYHETGSMSERALMFTRNVLSY